VREQTAGRWRIRTTLGAFSTHLPESHQVRSNLAPARVVPGHTRWATQGATILDNASPLNEPTLGASTDEPVAVSSTDEPVAVSSIRWPCHGRCSAGHTPPGPDHPDGQRV
jgi:hypothetical protein